MKWLKLAGTLTALAVLLAGTAAYAALTNTDWLKAKLADTVREKWRRTLTIEGELSLSLWPDVGFRVGRTRLSEVDSGETFAAFEQARLSVAAWPLLDRKVVVTSSGMDGLDLALIRRRDGTLNAAGLLPAAPADRAAPDKSSWTFDIAGLQLADARLAWHDQRTGKTVAVSALTLATGRAAGDLAARAFQVATPRLTARLAEGSRTASVRAATPAIAVADGKWTIAGLDLDVDAHIGAARLATRLTSALAVEPPEGTPGAMPALVFAGIAGRIDLTHPQLPAGSLTLPVTGRLKADPGGPAVAGTLASRLDGSSIALRFDVTRFAPLALVFDLGVDHLDLDKYLARNKDDDSGRIDLSALQGMDVRGDIRIGRLKLGQVTASNIALTFDSAAGALELTPRAASGGTARRGGGKPPARPAGH